MLECSSLAALAASTTSRTAFAPKYVKPDSSQSNIVCNESNFHKSDLSRTETYNVRRSRYQKNFGTNKNRHDSKERQQRHFKCINDLDNKLLVAMSDNPPPMLEKSTGNDNNK